MTLLPPAALHTDPTSGLAGPTTARVGHWTRTAAATATGLTGQTQPPTSTFTWPVFSFFSLLTPCNLSSLPLPHPPPSLPPSLPTSLDLHRTSSDAELMARDGQEVMATEADGQQQQQGGNSQESPRPTFPQVFNSHFYIL